MPERTAAQLRDENQSARRFLISPLMARPRNQQSGPINNLGNLKLAKTSLSSVFTRWLAVSKRRVMHPLQPSRTPLLGIGRRGGGTSRVSRLAPPFQAVPPRYRRFPEERSIASLRAAGLRASKCRVPQRPDRV